MEEFQAQSEGLSSQLNLRSLSKLTQFKIIHVLSPKAIYNLWIHDLQLSLNEIPPSIVQLIIHGNEISFSPIEIASLPDLS